MMKLITAIVNKKDVNEVSDALREKGFSFTRMASRRSHSRKRLFFYENGFDGWIFNGGQHHSSHRHRGRESGSGA